jgi:hypothetical protein
MLFTEGTTTTHLKVVRLSSDPTPVLDHQVPLFVEHQSSFCDEQWDLTTQQVLPYIDGFNHVAKIAAEADVENNLVKSCIQNLMYVLIPLFERTFCELSVQQNNILFQLLWCCPANTDISVFKRIRSDTTTTSTC